MKKSLINPVLHEIRSANPLKTRYSVENINNSSNKYQNSIDGMAGVGYNRDSNKLRQLQQDASTIATGARPNPEKNEKRFMGLFGNDVFNEPQKTMNSKDLQMRQNLEMLRHGNANRRFEKSNTVKKGSYENGIAGAGYSGEIVVTPKKGRPYKGQPNSLPLVSKRQKINKANGDPPPTPPTTEEGISIWDKIIVGLELGLSPMGSVQLAGLIGGGLKWAGMKNVPKFLGYAGRLLEPLDIGAAANVAYDAGNAAIKEREYEKNNSFPEVNYYNPIQSTNYVKNFDSYGDAAVNNPYGIIPHDWDIWGAGKDISPVVRGVLSWVPQKTNPEQKYWYGLKGTPPEPNYSNFSDLPLHRQFEEQMWGRPVETRRTPSLAETVGQMLVMPTTGQMVYPEGKNINTFDFNLLADAQYMFGDVGSNYAMSEGVLSDVEGWTKGGKRRKTNIYRDQPDSQNLQNLKPYSTDLIRPFYQTKNDPKLIHGPATWFNALKGKNGNPFYSANTVNDYTYENEYRNDAMTPDKEWMIGARYHGFGPYGDVNRTAIFQQPEKSWGQQLTDWYNSTPKNNQTQNNSNSYTLSKPKNSIPQQSNSEWNDVSDPKLIGKRLSEKPKTFAKSLITNKNKFDANKKSLNFTKSLNSEQNKYDTVLKNQIPSRNKYLK